MTEFRRLRPEPVILRNEKRRSLACLRASPGGKSTALIPRGQFCAGCPYWSCRSGKSEKESGYCSLLGLGDWMHGGTAHLWDGLKSCGRKENEDPASRPRFAVRRAKEARNGGPPLRTPRRRSLADRYREWEEPWWSRPWAWRAQESEGSSGGTRPATGTGTLESKPSVAPEGDATVDDLLTRDKIAAGSGMLKRSEITALRQSKADLGALAHETFKDWAPASRLAR